MTVGRSNSTACAPARRVSRPHGAAPPDHQRNAVSGGASTGVSERFRPTVPAMAIAGLLFMGRMRRSEVSALRPARGADTAPGTLSPAAARRRWSERSATPGRSAAGRTPDAWRSSGAPHRLDLRRAKGSPASSWSTFAYSNSFSISSSPILACSRRSSSFRASGARLFRLAWPAARNRSRHCEARAAVILWVANYYSARNPLRLSSLVILGVVARMFRCATRSSCWCT